MPVRCYENRRESKVTRRGYANSGRTRQWHHHRACGRVNVRRLLPLPLLLLCCCLWHPSSGACTTHAPAASNLRAPTRPRRSGCPSARRAPRLNRSSSQHQHHCARHAAGSVASTVILGTGEGKAAPRLSRASAPDSSPSALPWPGSQLLVLSTARRHLDVLNNLCTRKRAARAQSWERARSAPGSSASPCSSPAGTDVAPHRLPLLEPAAAGRWRRGTETKKKGTCTVGRTHELIKGGPSQYPEEAAALAFFRVPRI